MNLNALLTRARAIDESFMPDEATIKTRSLSTDSYGAPSASYSAGSTVKCRLTFVGAHPGFKDAIIGAGIQSDEAYLVALPHGTSVAKTARLEINSTDFEIVTELVTPSFQIDIQCLVKRIGAAVAAAAEYLLLEIGDNLLLETGDELVLE